MGVSRAIRNVRGWVFRATCGRFVGFCWLLLAFLALNVEIRRRNVEIRSGNWGVGRRFGFCGTGVGIGFGADLLASVIGFVSQKLCELSFLGRLNVTVYRASRS